jgi:hypothetical protein
MNQKTLPTSRKKLRSISTTSSGPGFVRRASALGMDETLPHFALGKRANLLAANLAQPSWLWGRRASCLPDVNQAWTPGYATTMSPIAHRTLKRFDISQTSALRLNP